MAEAKVANPYLAGRTEWNERYHDLIVAMKNWRLIAVLASCVALVSGLGNIVNSLKPKVIPYVVETDKIGKIVGEGTAKPADLSNDKLIRAAIWSWVGDWRMVSSDTQVEKAAIVRVYAHVAKSTAAAMKISNAYRDASPLKLGQSETITVDVNAAYAASKNSYEIDWTETTFDLNGSQISKQRYKGIVTYSLNPNASDAPTDASGRQTPNPLGLYVSDISWSKLL